MAQIYTRTAQEQRALFETAADRSPVSFVITIPNDAVELVVRLLDGNKREIDRVIVGALNDAVRKVQREAVGRIHKRLNVTKAMIRGTTRIWTANRHDQTVMFRLKRTRRLPLKRFKPRQIGGTGQWGAERRKRDEAALLKDTARLVRGRIYAGPNPKAGVTYKIDRARGRGFLPQGFIGGQRLGFHVWKREKGAGRLPIYMPRAVSPWGMFVKNKMGDEVIKVGREEMLALLKRRLNFRLGVLSGRIEAKGFRA